MECRIIISDVQVLQEMYSLIENMAADIQEDIEALQMHMEAGSDLGYRTALELQEEEQLTELTIRKM